MNFKNIVFNIFLLTSLLLISCSDDDNSFGNEDQDVKFNTFSFLHQNNPSLNNNYGFLIEDNKISVRLPFQADIKNLVATFTHNGSEVLINNELQASGISSNNFSNVLTYTLNSSKNKTSVNEVDVTYFTGLPIIYINTNDRVPIDSKEEYRKGDVHLDGGRYFMDMASSEMKIRGRGNSTWWVSDKKPYQLKFSDKMEFLEMPKDKKWIFLAEFSDKSLMRNRIAFEMGHLSSLDWTPQSAYAEIVVNDEYRGTYNVSQKVEESDNRVAIGDTGYLLEIDQLDRLDPDDVYFKTKKFLINIKEPELEYDSSEYKYVKDLLNNFEIVLMSDDFTNPELGYEKYIDVDSFIDWYLINEITKNQDSRNFSSIFLNLIPGEKIKMGPIWDFDLAFGNVNYSECEHPEGFWIKHHHWYARLFEDPVFKNKVKERFSHFRNNQSFIIEKIDSFALQLQWAQYENDKKWNLFGRYVWPNPVFFNSHKEEVEHLKDWYIKRMNWLDNAFKDL